MAGRRVYRADSVVLEECARRGAPDITVRKLERWRRCLPRRDVEHRPGVRGSRSGNPSGYVDQVIAIDALVKSGVSLRDVPMRLFEQGFPVDLVVLREAYSRIYTRVRDGLLAGSPDAVLAGVDVEPADRADALARVHAKGIRRSATGRRWAERITRRGRQGDMAESDDTNTVFVSVISAMFTWLLAGQAPSSQGVVDTLAAAGLDDGQDPDTAAAHLTAININAICAAIEAATEEQWLSARQDIDLLARYAKLRQKVDQRWQSDESFLPGINDVGLDDPAVRSLFIPIALVLGEPWRQGLREQYEQYQAANQLLDDLPDKFLPFIRPDDEAPLREQSEKFRVELSGFLLAWSRQHPTYATALNFESPPAG